MAVSRIYDAVAIRDANGPVAHTAPSKFDAPESGGLGLEGAVSGGRRSGRAPRSVRIALADPDTKVRDWLRIPLSRLTANISEAASGPELEGLLRDEGPFDLVITNAQLPGGRSGLQVLARLRSSGSPTPFIVLTSIHNESLRVFVSDAEGTVLSSRVVDPQNLVGLAASLMPRTTMPGDQG
jgi:CheY-like chemotaxis protein